MKHPGLGWDAFFESQVAPGATVARVVAVERGACRVAGDYDGLAEISGRFRHDAVSESDYPAVGDWVVLSSDGGLALIQRRLDRRSAIIRAAAGRAVTPQVIAANVDTVFVVTSADADLNPRRLERYLAMLWDSGAVPVIVVNKIDLVERPDDAIGPLRERVPLVDIVALSALGPDVAFLLAAYLQPGRTVALVGSSGVGKSTIVNRLVGRDVQRVSTVRESDGRGRHTTTARHLIELSGGALLIDTPGMRELQPWVEASAVEGTFDDIAALAADCRYGDCRHEQEPGCAVQAAIAAGSIHVDRVEHYRRLLREVAFNATKRDKAAAAETKRRWKQASQALKALYRDRDRLG